MQPYQPRPVEWGPWLGPLPQPPPAPMSNAEIGRLIQERQRLNPRPPKPPPATPGADRAPTQAEYLDAREKQKAFYARMKENAAVLREGDETSVAAAKLLSQSAPPGSASSSAACAPAPPSMADPSVAASSPKEGWAPSPPTIQDAHPGAAWRASPVASTARLSPADCDVMPTWQLTATAVALAHMLPAGALSAHFVPGVLGGSAGADRFRHGGQCGYGSPRGFAGPRCAARRCQ
jgi:hypothetical protein